MSSRPRPKTMLPLGAYVALNAVVLAALTATYVAADWYARRNGLAFRGLFPVLATCYLAFLFVSIYDRVFEWFAFRGEGRSDADDAGE